MALCLLAGCASPLEQVPRLADVDIADAPVADLAAGRHGGPGLVETEGSGDGRGGVLGRLFGGRATEVSEGEAAAEHCAGGVGGASPGEASTVARAGAAAGAAPRQVGVLARLFGGGARDAGAVTVDAAEVTPASAEPPAHPAIGGVTRVCGVARRELGTEVGASGGFRLFDTIPQATAARPHYITGFSDGCARRFDAALAFIGDPGRHEVARYDRMNRSVPWTELDDAYEAIKSRLCHVPVRQPCGARMGRVARSTAFVSAYPTFGTNQAWTEILLHRRKLLAVAEKSRQ